MEHQDQDELSEQVRAISSFLKGRPNSSGERPRSPGAASIVQDPTTKKQSLCSSVREPSTTGGLYMEYGQTSRGFPSMDKHDCGPPPGDSPSPDNNNNGVGASSSGLTTPSSGKTCGNSSLLSSKGFDSATTPPSTCGSSPKDCQENPDKQTHITAQDSPRDSGYESGVISPTLATGAEGIVGHVPEYSLPGPSITKDPGTNATPFTASPCQNLPQPLLQSTQQTLAGSKIKPLLLSEPVLTARPTVLTVELAAAAKIYLETYFNELLCGLSPRDRRMHHMENWLYKTRGLDFITKQKYRAAFYQTESNHLRETRVLKAKCTKTLIYGEEGTKHCPPSLTCASDFQLLKVLGKGSFGTVALVRRKPNEYDAPNVAEAKQKQFFAMKVIRKSQMVRSGQEGHLRAERDFLVASEGSNWVVPLVESFQDVSSLYLVMEYMPGGDFLSLLVRENILDEAVSRFYIAEMILCVEEAHALQYIHRDIKPDNFLISASGHLKISDFGLAFDGHWSHDSRYHSSTRYSLLQNLGIYVEGDATDQKKDASLNRPQAMSCSPGMLAGIEKHQRQPVLDADDEPILQ